MSKPLTLKTTQHPNNKTTTTIQTMTDTPLEMVQTLNTQDTIIDVNVDDRQQQHSPTLAPSPLPPQQQPPKYNKLHAVASILYCILFYFIPMVVFLALLTTSALLTVYPFPRMNPLFKETTKLFINSFVLIIFRRMIERMMDMVTTWMDKTIKKGINEFLA